MNIEAYPAPNRHKAVQQALDIGDLIKAVADTKYLTREQAAEAVAMLPDITLGQYLGECRRIRDQVDRARSDLADKG